MTPERAGARRPEPTSIAMTRQATRAHARRTARRLATAAGLSAAAPGRANTPARRTSTLSAAVPSARAPVPPPLPPRAAPHWVPTREASSATAVPASDRPAICADYGRVSCSARRPPLLRLPIPRDDQYTEWGRKHRPHQGEHRRARTTRTTGTASSTSVLPRAIRPDRRHVG
jgi:hypothetical protein